MNRNKVILVDRNDNAIGEMDKMSAHIAGNLHRAFSVFIFNEKDEILLQQRAREKYHGGGLWTNACCSHPQMGENVKESAIERLKFEMGLTCDIQEAFAFIYCTPVENGLTEHEYDYVFWGYTTDNPVPNPDEVLDYAWQNAEFVLFDIKLNPGKYTEWFKMALPKVLSFKRKVPVL